MSRLHHLTIASLAAHHLAISPPGEVEERRGVRLLFVARFARDTLKEEAGSDGCEEGGDPGSVFSA
jgi:hypothetical protein